VHLKTTRVHYAWKVAAVAFLALVISSGFRSVTGVLLIPLHEEVAWSHETIGLAVSPNLLCFGLGAPFAAALIERFGVRRVVGGALAAIAISSLLTIGMTETWQLFLLWGLVNGCATGAVSVPLAAIIANRWFEQRRGLVTGLMTASYASGQLIFLPALADAARTRVFWLLAGTFFVCGATTNGLISTHLIPAAHDHGITQVTAAGLLALIGVFDVVGTTASGWLTDRYDPRKLLVAYYGLRGASLLALPVAFDTAQAAMIAFVVVYGLDWVATVPPTSSLATTHFGPQAGVVFAWIFTAHQLGAAAAAWGAGLVRTATGEYTAAFLAAGILGLLAAAAVPLIRRPRTRFDAPLPVPMA
jgi:MFS family permease